MGRAHRACSPQNADLNVVLFLEVDVSKRSSSVKSSNTGFAGEPRGPWLSIRICFVYFHDVVIKYYLLFAELVIWWRVREETCFHFNTLGLETSEGNSGRSRISQMGLHQPWKGDANLWFGQFSQKLHENEEILDRGRRINHASPRSAIGKHEIFWVGALVQHLVDLPLVSVST